MADELVLVYGRPQVECDREYRAFMLAHLTHQRAMGGCVPLFIDIESTSEQGLQRVVVSRPTRQSKLIHQGKRRKATHSK